MDLRITTEIRGEPRTLIWTGGMLSGDEELLDRVLRCAESLRLDLQDADSLDLIRICQHATPAPLEIVPLVDGLDAGRRPMVDLTEPADAQSFDETFSAPA